jgi:hypothetical protein
MRGYILGAGASVDAGYPLYSNLAVQLTRWIEQNKPTNHEYRIFLEQVGARFGKLDDLEQFLIDLDTRRFGLPKAGAEEESAILASMQPTLRKAICECFDDIRQAKSAEAYQRFAGERVHAGDVVITFNYDVSLDRELRNPEKWDIGNGYGFRIFPSITADSPVKLLKLHGSTNWRGQLFGGSTGSTRGVSPDSRSLGFRPVIRDSEFEYLGYQGLRDPLSKATVDIHPIVLPARHKRFYEETTYGREWEQFWSGLWRQASISLGKSERLIILGYSLPRPDTRGRELLFHHTRREIPVEVCCLGQSDQIAEELRNHGFSCVEPEGNVPFEEWVQR